MNFRHWIAWSRTFWHKLGGGAFARVSKSMRPSYNVENSQEKNYFAEISFRPVLISSSRVICNFPSLELFNNLYSGACGCLPRCYLSVIIWEKNWLFPIIDWGVGWLYIEMERPISQRRHLGHLAGPSLMTLCANAKFVQIWIFQMGKVTKRATNFILVLVIKTAVCDKNRRFTK